MYKSAQNAQLHLVRRIFDYVRTHAPHKDLSLDQIASALGTPVAQITKVFHHWTGISLMKYRDILLSRKVNMVHGHAKPMQPPPPEQRTVTITPRTSMDNIDKGMTLSFGFSQSPVGEVLISGNESGIFWLSFVYNREEAFTHLQRAFPNVRLTSTPQYARTQSLAIFYQHAPNIAITLIGNSFALKTWGALTTIKTSHMLTYQDIAQKIGNPKAYRAVGNALAKNRIAYLVPCHRIIGPNNGLGNYRWGQDYKRRLFLWEKGSKSTPKL